MVADAQDIERAASGKPPHRHDHADQAAVKRHAALPYEQYVEGVRQIVIGAVDQDVAEPAAENHAERRPDDEVVDVPFLERRVRQAGQGDDIAPTQQQAGDIGQRVPTYREWSDLYENRIDGGIREDGRKQRS